jgi:dienelactone hydrolase
MSSAVQAGRRADELPLHLFAYDRGLDLDVREVSRSDVGTSTVVDLSYASPKGGRVTAYLFAPKGPGPFPGLLLQHGLPASRDQMLPDGVRFAAAGAVVLAIDAPFARSQRPPLYFTEQDRLDQIQLIVDLQRGVDLLLSRGDVDPARLAYFGIS